MQSSQLIKLFEDELRDIYWIEKAVVSAIPRMIKNTTSLELFDALTNHLTDAAARITRVERVFGIVGKRPYTRKCLAIEGLLKEASDMMGLRDPGAMCDAAIITVAQKIQHNEISSFETLRQFAEILGLDEAVELFEATLDEHKTSAEEYTGVSVAAIQVYASMEEDEETELEFDQEYNSHFA